MTTSGKLRPILESSRYLDNRTSAVRFSPDGRFLAVSSIHAGSVALASGSTDEINDPFDTTDG